MFHEVWMQLIQNFHMSSVLFCHQTFQVTSLLDCSVWNNKKKKKKIEFQNILPDLVLSVCRSRWLRGSKAWIVFNCSNTEIMGFNGTGGMDVCVRLFYVYVVLCVGSSFVMGWSPVQGALPTVYKISKLKERPKPNKRALEPNKLEEFNFLLNNSQD
jgi:hypothetical protein